MVDLIKKKINEAKSRLRRADAPTSSLFAASCSLASIIVAVENLISVIQDQQAEIETLKASLTVGQKENNHVGI